MQNSSIRLREGGTVAPADLERIVEFLKNFADKCHHGKEEGILFPEIAKNPAHIKAVNELLGEHKTGRDFIRGVAESIPDYEAGNPDAYHIAANCEGYVQLLAGHIKKENILLDAADKEIPVEIQDQIAQRLENLETEVIGPGKHEEYRSWLKELKNIYLA